MNSAVRPPYSLKRPTPLTLPLTQFVRSGREAHRDLEMRMEDLASWALRVKQYKLHDPEKERETELITVRFSKGVGRGVD